MNTHNICFHGEINSFSCKNQYFLVDFLNTMLSIFFTFIDHESRMTQIDSFEFHFFITYL